MSRLIFRIVCVGYVAIVLALPLRAGAADLTCVVGDKSAKLTNPMRTQIVPPTFTCTGMYQFTPTMKPINVTAPHVIWATGDPAQYYWVTDSKGVRTNYAPPPRPQGSPAKVKNPQPVGTMDVPPPPNGAVCKLVAISEAEYAWWRDIQGTMNRAWDLPLTYPSTTAVKSYDCTYAGVLK